MANSKKFKMLQDSKYVLAKKTPLMPAFEPKGFWRGIKALKNIRIINAGVVLEFIEERKKQSNMWYKVKIQGTLVTGWINGINLEVNNAAN